MISAKAHDGDLPPGVYERMPDGSLRPTKKLLTNDPPRPIIKELSRNGKDEITNVTGAGVAWMAEELEKHYELRRQLRPEAALLDVVARRNMAERAAEQIMGSL